MALGFSPLDEVLGLVPATALSPGWLERLVRLGVALPFAEAATLFTTFTGVTLSAETVRRWTERAGAAQVARETAAVAQLARDLPASPAGPVRQQLSADGCMVPLVGGQWAEARLLAIGTLPSNAADAPQTTDLSYFGRLTDAATFGDLATLETHRRGTATAGTVVAVTDGAPWLQDLIDLQRPDAVRILDFPHALEHLSQAAQAVYGVGTDAASDWLGVQTQTLRHGDPADVLAALTTLAAGAPTPEVAAVITGCHAYLAARREQITYAAFAAQGYPLGSGIVESGHKLVIEARLKGAGMHWTRDAVNELVALRGTERSGRWAQDWPAILAALRSRPRAARRVIPTSAPSWPPPSRPLLALPTPAPLLALPAPRPVPPPKRVVDGKPTDDHPWRRFRLPGSRDVSRSAKS